MRREKRQKSHQNGDDPCEPVVLSSAPRSVGTAWRVSLSLSLGDFRDCAFHLFVPSTHAARRRYS